MRLRYILLIVIILIAGLSFGLHLHWQKPVISKEIQKHAQFTIFTPDQSQSPWAVDTSKVQYSSKNGVLTFTIDNKDGNKIVASEQTLPDPFNDIPNYKTIFLSKLNEYKELPLPIGSVALTKPTELNGRQSAILISKGTLMFFNPRNNLSDDQWRDFFSSLSILNS